MTAIHILCCNVHTAVILTHWAVNTLIITVHIHGITKFEISFSQGMHAPPPPQCFSDAPDHVKIISCILIVTVKLNVPF